MSAVNALYELREAIQICDVSAVESLLSNSSGGVSDNESRVELILSSFQAGDDDGNGDDESKLRLWGVLSSAWSDTIDATPQRFLQDAIANAPTPIFQELIKRVEAKLTPLERHNAFFGCEGYASSDEKESLRKAAFDRAERDRAGN